MGRISKMKVICCRCFIGLSLIILSVLLIDCGEKNQNAPFTVMYLQIWADSLNSQFESLCKEWGKTNGVQVNLVQVSLNDLDSKIAALIEARAGADLAVFPAHLAIVYHEYLADMSDVADHIEKTYGGFYDVAKQMNNQNDKWVGIPLYAWSHLIVYRRDLLDSLHLSPANDFYELANIAVKMNNPSKGMWGLGIGLGRDDDIAMFFQSLLWSFGGKVFESDGKTVAINSAETRAAVNYMINLYKKGVIPKGAFGWDGAANNRNFLAGSIAITANSPTIYYVAKQEQSPLADKILETIYPEGPGGRFSYATGFSLAVLKGDDRLAEAKSLIRYIYQRENFIKLINSGKGSVDPLVHGLDTLEIWKDPNLMPAIKSLEIMKPVGWPGPVTRASAEVFQRRVVTDILSRVLNDGLTIDEAVNEAENEISEIVSSHTK